MIGLHVLKFNKFINIFYNFDIMKTIRFILLHFHYIVLEFTMFWQDPLLYTFYCLINFLWSICMKPNVLFYIRSLLNYIINIYRFRRIFWVFKKKMFEFTNKKIFIWKLLLDPFGIPIAKSSYDCRKCFIFRLLLLNIISFIKRWLISYVRRFLCMFSIDCRFSALKSAYCFIDLHCD